MQSRGDDAIDGYVRRSHLLAVEDQLAELKTNAAVVNSRGDLSCNHLSATVQTCLPHHADSKYILSTKAMSFPVRPPTLLNVLLMPCAAFEMLEPADDVTLLRPSEALLCAELAVAVALSLAAAAVSDALDAVFLAASLALEAVFFAAELAWAVVELQRMAERVLSCADRRRTAREADSDIITGAIERVARGDGWRLLRLWSGVLCQLADGLLVGV